MTIATGYLSEHEVPLFLSRFSALPSQCIWSAPPRVVMAGGETDGQHCGEARDRIHPVSSFNLHEVRCDTDRARGLWAKATAGICRYVSKEMQTDHWRRGVSEDSGDGEQAQAPQTPTRPHCFHPHPHPHFIHPQHTSSSPPAARESQPPLTPTTPIGPIVAQHPRPGTGPHLPPSPLFPRPPSRPDMSRASLPLPEADHGHQPARLPSQAVT